MEFTLRTARRRPKKITCSDLPFETLTSRSYRLSITHRLRGGGATSVYLKVTKKKVLSLCGVY
jgi:hypothetical protein